MALPTYCAYHGYADLPFTGQILAGGAGRFRTGLQNNRLVLVCPEAVPHVWPWLMVWRLDVSGTQEDGHGTYVPSGGLSQLDYVARKYGGRTQAYWDVQRQRLHQWGFTGLQAYGALGAVGAYSGIAPEGKHLPFVVWVRPNYYGSFNNRGYAPGAFKNLYQVKTQYHDTVGEHFPDIFDPNYQLYTRGMLAAEIPWSVNVPTVLGVNIDDTDQLRGFGAGPDFSAEGRNNPHLGWITAVSRAWVPSGWDFTVSNRSDGSAGNQTYAMPQHFTKLALRDFLQAKYGPLTAFNSAWGSNYTTYGESDPTSHTGWPSGTGTGFLDEDGRHPWMGGPGFHNLASDLTAEGIPAAVKADLDAFLREISKKYHAIGRTEAKAQDPNRLYLGCMDLGTWGAPPHKEVLQGAAPYCDVVHGAFFTAGQPDLQARIDFMATHLGETTPLASWVGFPANADSALHNYPGGYPTQAARGAAYQQVLDALLGATSPAGRKLCVGLSWWGWHDQFDEQTDWGLVSYRGAAYDGVECTTLAHVDQWGYTTIPEDRNYGDFITPVTAANVGALATFAAQLGAPSPGPGPTLPPIPPPIPPPTPGGPMALTVTPQPVARGADIQVALDHIVSTRFAVLILLGPEQVPGSRDISYTYLDGGSAPPAAPVVTGRVTIRLPTDKADGRWAVVIVNFPDGPFQGAGTEIARTVFTVGPVLTPDPPPDLPPNVPPVLPPPDPTADPALLARLAAVEETQAVQESINAAFNAQIVALSGSLAQARQQVDMLNGWVLATQEGTAALKALLLALDVWLAAVKGAP